MESLKPSGSRISPLLPHQQGTRFIALSGLPGAGVFTVSKLLCTEFEAMSLSMAAYPRLRLEAEGGVSGDVDARMADFRLQRERADKLVWVRPFHRRLMRLLRFAPPPRIVISGLLTQTELAYCKTLGARLIHLTAAPEIRRQRIGVRFPDHPIEALDLLDRLVHSQPQTWDLIVDTDEPYPEFIRGVRAQIARF